MTLLVVEDLIEVQSIIAAQLKRSPLPEHKLLFAQDIHEAGNQCLHGPDAILFDLGLKTSGPDETLIALPTFTERFPTLVLSGHPEGKYWNKSVREAGAMDYLPKMVYLAQGSETFLAHAIFNAILTHPYRR